jgi:hypothetical protein
LGNPQMPPRNQGEKVLGIRDRVEVNPEISQQVVLKVLKIMDRMRQRKSLDF